jgi:hypothetical protein
MQITSPRTRVWAGNPLSPIDSISQGTVPSIVGPSGIAAPTGSITGWTLIVSEGFDVPVPLGNWPYGVSHYRPRWRTYDVGTRDTTPGKGLYDDARTNTVAGSCLRADMHYDATSGEHLVSLSTFAVVPDAASTALTGQIYGRYSICMKATYTGAGTSGAHKVVPLLWPRDDVWPAHGEVDWPECAITPSATATAYMHYANAGGGQDIRNSSALISAWHVYTTEWSPNLARFFVDGTQVGADCVTNIPSTEMRWTLQFETEITSALTSITSATDTLTKAGHGLNTGDVVKFEVTGGASGVALGIHYYVVSALSGTFKVSATRGGSPITLGTASGITVRRWPAPDDSALVEVDWCAMYAYTP